MMFQLFSKNTNKAAGGKLTPERKKKLKELCKKINVNISALSLLDRALTHSSAIDRGAGCSENYERLEFLGDSILNASMAYVLFQKYPGLSEGELSAFRSSLVDEKTLAEIGFILELPDYINLGKGETLSDYRAREKVTADIVEAIIGVVFIEKGFKTAYRFTDWIMKDHVQKRIKKGTRDFKTQLQKFSVAKWRDYPVYRVVNETGPDHNKIFEVRVEVGGKYSASARGRTKKEAEQKAAEKVWAQVRHEAGGRQGHKEKEGDKTDTRG